MSLKIVKIGNKYAIRKGWIFHEYKSFITNNWLKKDDSFFENCLAEFKDVYEKYLLLTAKEVVIKTDDPFCEEIYDISKEKQARIKEHLLNCRLSALENDIKLLKRCFRI